MGVDRHRDFDVRVSDDVADDVQRDPEVEKQGNTVWRTLATSAGATLKDPMKRSPTHHPSSRSATCTSLTDAILR
jgi:hypothetical protein